MPEDARLATELAVGAGRILVELRTRIDAAASTLSAAELKAAGDAAAQAYLGAALARTHPDDAVLSEEAIDDPRRATADRVWIVDPLDGTREFAEHTEDGGWRDDFAVHLALWQRGTGLTDAVVALPGRGQVHSSADPGRRDGSDPAAVEAGQRALRVAVSRSRPPAIVERLVRCADVELVSMGSAGVKAMAVVDGTVDAYVHAGGQYEWDSAAPVAVARAAGMVASRLDGSPLVFNQADPWSPDLLICHPVIHAYLARLLAAAGLDDVLDARPAADHPTRVDRR